MKRVLILSPYFLPSNLAGVQRARLMARWLAEYGWKPIVLAVEPGCYEEPNDNASLALLPPELRVERTGAWPASLCRPLGFGDISLRAQWGMRRKVADLVKGAQADLVFVTVLPGYASLVGAWAKRRFNLPFVLDYQDPWVSDWGARQSLFSKAGLAHWLARKLEPGAVRLADALTAVSEETLDTLRDRHLIKPGTPIEIIPIGADLQDHIVATRVGRSHITKEPGAFDLVYLGTLTDRMLPALRALLRAICSLSAASPRPRLRLHLIGTSAQPDGQDKLGVAQLARELGAQDLIRLEPRRLGYLDALRTMQDADSLLLLGSTDSHYTASKLFPCWLARKPILALFHSESTVNKLSTELGGVELVTYNNTEGPEERVQSVTAALSEIIQCGGRISHPRDESAFEPYSARGCARRYAGLFDRVLNATKRAI